MKVKPESPTEAAEPSCGGQRCIVRCMPRTYIYLDPDQARALDRLAADEGRTRSDLIRELIDRALSGGDDDLEGDLLAIDDSFGAMRDADSAARGRDDRSEHLDRMWRSDT